MLYPVRRLHLAVEFEAVTILSRWGYRAADSSFMWAGAGVRVAMGLDIAKNPLWWRLARCSKRHAKACHAGMAGRAGNGHDRGLTLHGYRVL